MWGFHMSIEFILLRPGQINREILDILNILTPTKQLSIIEARNIITLQLKNNHMTYVGYIDGEAVCMGSFVILNKLGQNGGRSALIEDVAVKPEYQNHGYGLSLINFLCKKATAYHVYKIILDCKDELEQFYSKAGFYKAGLYMRKNI